MLRKSKLFIVLALIGVFGLYGATAFADTTQLELRISNGAGNSVILYGVAQNGGYYVNNPLPISVGAYMINIATGTQGIGAEYMDLNSINISATGAETAPLVIELSVINQTAEWSGFQMLIGGTLNSLSNSATGKYTSYYDTGNTFFGYANTLGTVDFASGPGGAFSGGITGAAALGGSPYSVTQRIEITPNGSTAVTFSGNATLNAVPEPAALVLLGTGLLTVAASRRRFPWTK